MSLRQAEVVAAAVVTLLGLFFILFSIPIYGVAIGSGPGGGVYPLWVAVLQTVCGLLYLRNSLRLPSGAKFISLDRQQWAWVWQSLVSVLLYVAAMPYLGFALATFLLMAFHLRVIGTRGKLFSVLFALGTAVACEWFFGIFLYMPLPRGFFTW